MTVALLPASLLDRLAALTLRARRRGAGVTTGGRKSPRRGRSQEFADHRPYVPGDDLRFLDWHLYGRLDALWIKLFEEEEDRVVQCLVDCSASMQGEKLAYARQLAGAMAFLALGVYIGTRVVAAPPPVPFDGNPKAQAALGISPRELTVLHEIAAGRSNKEIATALGVSPNTVKTHIARLFEKLEAKRRTDALAKARELGLVP